MIRFFELSIEIIQYHQEKNKTGTKSWKQTVIQLIIMELFEFKDSLLHGGFSINGCSIICSNSNSCIRLEIPWKNHHKNGKLPYKVFPPTGLHHSTWIFWLNLVLIFSCLNFPEARKKNNPSYSISTILWSTWLLRETCYTSPRSFGNCSYEMRSIFFMHLDL